MINDGSNIGVGFDRYYITTGEVWFDQSSTHPLKIGVSEVFLYQDPLSEEEVLDLFRNTLLWNAIGKKSLGRGRRLSHQTNEEDWLYCKMDRKLFAIWSSW